MKILSSVATCRRNNQNDWKKGLCIPNAQDFKLTLTYSVSSPRFYLPFQKLNQKTTMQMIQIIFQKLPR